MKLNKNHIQTFIFVIVYLFALYFWTQPLREIRMPYGEYDAMSHFEVADYMAYNDKSFQQLPPYIDIRYGPDNKFKPHTLWYPPTFHSSLAAASVFGGDRTISIFLMNTILTSFIIISVYFVINSLFGFLPAVLSDFLIIFSPRDFMPYLWGQWPERFGYALVPIILYCFYKYLTSYSKNESKPIYLYLCSLFLGINILIHPLVFFHSVFGLTVLYIFLTLKQKKIVFKIKQILIALIIFLILFLLFPYQTFNIFPQLGFKKETNTNNVETAKPLDFSRLFKWSFNPQDYAGSVPSSYFSYKEMHGLWTLPFLLIGILFLAWRREEKDIFMLAWLVSLYIVLHRDFFGQGHFLHRSLSASAHIFAPLTAIGAIYLGSVVKLLSKFNTYIKYALAVTFIYFVVTVNMAYASALINKSTYNPKTQYGFLVTLNEQEYKAAQWLLDNVPLSYNISVLGIPHTQNFLEATAKKIRWLAAVSQHVNRFYYLQENKEDFVKSPEWFILLDYTLIGPLSDKELFEQMQEFEKNLTKHKLVYDEGNIRIYKYETA